MSQALKRVRANESQSKKSKSSWSNSNSKSTASNESRWGKASKKAPAPVKTVRKPLFKKSIATAKAPPPSGPINSITEQINKAFNYQPKTSLSAETSRSSKGIKINMGKLNEFTRNRYSRRNSQSPNFKETKNMMRNIESNQYQSTFADEERDIMAGESSFQKVKFKEPKIKQQIQLVKEDQNVREQQ